MFKKVMQLDAGTYEIGKEPNIGRIGYMYVVNTSSDTSTEYFVLEQPNTYPISLDMGQSAVFSVQEAGPFGSPEDFYNWACEQLQTSDVNGYLVDTDWSGWTP